jgi:hypothetical protein
MAFQAEASMASLLESAALKMSSVLSDLHGMTGRDIMGHLIGGERNPKVLAQLARGKARRRIRELEAAADDPLADAEPAGDFGLGHLR